MSLSTLVKNLFSFKNKKVSLGGLSFYTLSSLCFLLVGRLFTAAWSYYDGCYQIYGNSFYRKW